MPRKPRLLLLRRQKLQRNRRVHQQRPPPENRQQQKVHPILPRLWALREMTQPKKEVLLLNSQLILKRAWQQVQRTQCFILSMNQVKVGRSFGIMGATQSGTQSTIPKMSSRIDFRLLTRLMVTRALRLTARILVCTDNIGARFCKKMTS